MLASQLAINFLSGKQLQNLNVATEHAQWCNGCYNNILPSQVASMQLVLASLLH